MKIKPSLALAAALGFSVIAIMLSGCVNGTPLSSNPVAGAFYNTQTNYTPQVSVITNTVPVTVFKTNEVPVTVQVTNTVGVTSYATNLVAVTVPMTNYLVVTQTVTNQVPSYVNTVKPTVAPLVQTGTSIINGFAPGIGTAIGMGILALLGGLGYATSSKQSSANYSTASALAQEIQVVRNFLRTLPNGPTMDAALTTWLNAHQNDAGVSQTVLTLLTNEVSNSSAQIAAQQLSQTITGLMASNPTPATPAAPKA